MTKSPKVKSPVPKSQTPKKPNYRQLRQELEEVLVQLQREDLDVDQALEFYRRGLDLIKQLEKHLDEAENKIRDIKSEFTAE